MLNFSASQRLRDVSTPSWTGLRIAPLCLQWVGSQISSSMCCARAHPEPRHGQEEGNVFLVFCPVRRLRHRRRLTRSRSRTSWRRSRGLIRRRPPASAAGRPSRTTAAALREGTPSRRRPPPPGTRGAAPLMWARGPAPTLARTTPRRPKKTAVSYPASLLSLLARHFLCLTRGLLLTGKCGHSALINALASISHGSPEYTSHDYAVCPQHCCILPIQAPQQQTGARRASRRTLAARRRTPARRRPSRTRRLIWPCWPRRPRSRRLTPP